MTSAERSWVLGNSAKLAVFISSWNHCILQTVHENSLPRFVVESAIHADLPHTKIYIEKNMVNMQGPSKE